MSLDTPNTKAGYAAIVGRPNVGKSTAATRTLRERLDRPSVYDTASLTLGTGLV